MTVWSKQKQEVKIYCRFDVEDFYFKFDVDDSVSEFWWEKCDTIFDFSFTTDVEVSWLDVEVVF